jgi:signal transduction histidine kinase
MTDNGIASIVRSLAQGVDPGRVLREVAQEALTRTATSHVLLAAMLEGQLTPLVAIGVAHSALFEAGREAFTTGRAARRSDPGQGLEALAVPVRHRGVPVAVLVVAGRPDDRRDPDVLLAAADCAALALATRPPTTLLTGAGDSSAAPENLAEGLAAIAAAGTTDEVVRVALDVAAGRFGARAGFVCLPAGPGGVEVVGWRAIDRERLGTASRHPGFTRLVSGPTTAVVAPGDPVVAQLTAGAEFAVCLPLEQNGPGALVILVAEEPDTAGRRALESLRVSVAAGLRAAATRAALDSAGARLSSLVQSVTDPVLVVDRAGRFTALNPAAAELFALSDSFEIGRPARGRLGHPALEGLLVGDGTDARGESLADGAEVVLGRPAPRRFVATARRLGDGRVLILRAGAVSPAGRETDDAAAGLARALREPLATITTLAGAAGAGTATGGEWEVARKGILAETARLEAVADQLALLADDGEGTAAVVVRLEPVDIVSLTAAVVESRRTTDPERSITIGSPPRLEARADRRLLERVIEPLLDNALRYSEGPVTVEVADRGETFEIAVVDTGPGIFSGDVPGLFERYHPLDGSPDRQGTGLSLYTCRRLVDLMGGRLWCDSRLGVGSRFALRLPYS